MMIIPPPPRKWREPHRCPSQQGTRESLKIIEIITVVIIIAIRIGPDFLLLRVSALKVLFLQHLCH